MEELMNDKKLSLKDRIAFFRFLKEEFKALGGVKGLLEFEDKIKLYKFYKSEFLNLDRLRAWSDLNEKIEFYRFFQEQQKMADREIDFVKHLHMMSSQQLALIFNHPKTSWYIKGHILLQKKVPTDVVFSAIYGGVQYLAEKAMRSPVEFSPQDLFLISRKGRFESVRTIAMTKFLENMESSRSRQSLEHLSMIYSKGRADQQLAA